jgi:hypothetical protein
MFNAVAKLLSTLTTILFSLSLVVQSIPTHAANTKNTQDDLKKIQKSIRDKDPNKLKSEKLTRKNKDVLVSKQENLEVEIDSGNKSTRINHKTKGNTTISIPNSNELTDIQTIDDQIIFSGQNAKFDVVVEALDGGMRQVINLKDSSAPTTYDFPVSLEAGEALVVTEDGSAMVTKPISTEEKTKRAELQKTAPEGITIPQYDAKTLIAKPWAKDAQGKDLKTYYTASGFTLKQTIDTTGAVFPIVADPIWCGDVTYNVQFNYRNMYGNVYKWSNQILPTYCGRAYFFSLIILGNPLAGIGGQLFSFQSWLAWSEVYNKTNSYGYHNGVWYYVWNKSNNYWGMYNQYICHLINPRTVDKYDYNLEPDRPDVGIFRTYWDGCNPPF